LVDDGVSGGEKRLCQRDAEAGTKVEDVLH
jgi:hypothetical protein